MMTLVADAIRCKYLGKYLRTVSRSNVSAGYLDGFAITSGPGAGMEAAVVVAATAARMGWTPPKPRQARGSGIIALQHWFERHPDVTKRSFGAAVGVQRGTVHRWLARKDYPTDNHIRAIFQITGVQLRPRGRRPRAARK